MKYLGVSYFYRHFIFQFHGLNNSIKERIRNAISSVIVKTGEASKAVKCVKAYNDDRIFFSLNHYSSMQQRCPWRRCRHRDAPAVAVAVQQR